MIFAFILTYVAASGSRLVGSSVGATAVHPGSFTEQAATTYQTKPCHLVKTPRQAVPEICDDKTKTRLVMESDVPFFGRGPLRAVLYCPV